MTAAETEFETMLDAFEPAIATLARASISRLRDILPPSRELVYDNYNALVIGFSPTEKTGHAVFSVAVYPRNVNLFFLQATRMPGFESEPRLVGDGSLVRRITIQSPRDFDDPEVRRLIDLAVDCARAPFSSEGTRSFVIRSVSAKPRPRRPPTR